MIALSVLNTLPEGEFVGALAGVFEHSPWIAQQAASERPFESRLQLLDCLRAVVRTAPSARQLALLRAHPELGLLRSAPASLTPASLREQRGAGLVDGAQAVLERLATLNTAYRKKFDFPFILAVRGHTPPSILQRLETRLQRSPETELASALAEVGRIAAYRLADAVDSGLGAEVLAMLERLSAADAAGAGSLIREWMHAAHLHVWDVDGALLGCTPPADAMVLTGLQRDAQSFKFAGHASVALALAVAQRLHTSATPHVQLAIYADPHGSIGHVTIVEDICVAIGELPFGTCARECLVHARGAIATDQPPLTVALSAAATAARPSGTDVEAAAQRLLTRLSLQPIHPCQSAHTMTQDNSQPARLRQFVNVANARLGAQALSASDEFFADKQRMLNPAEPEFRVGIYDENGKWMDGWETRRRRDAGFDHCVVQLAAPARLFALDLDTRYFTGNYPPFASVQACRAERVPDASTAWTEVLARAPLSGNQHNYFDLTGDQVWTHLRLNIYPDGGIARLRAYGRIEKDWQRSLANRESLDLASALLGGSAVACNDEHYGAMGNLLLPGRGINMGDGWETRRRREPGFDWVILQLAHVGVLDRVEVDTAHFKGNYPHAVSMNAALLPASSGSNVAASSLNWPILLEQQRLSADAVHAFTTLSSLGPVSHVRVNTHPDGGLSRVRLHGVPWRA